MKKGKGTEAPPPPPPAPVDTTAQDLLALYAKERVQDRSDLLEFTHAKYQDWHRYFGFSMAHELAWQRAEGEPRKGTKPLRATVSLMNTSAPTPAGAAPAVSASADEAVGRRKGAKVQPDTICPIASNEPTPEACWTLPTGIEAADQHALQAGPLTQCTTTAAVTDVLAAPYRQVTWRHSQSQCDHLKVRAIYRWLCQNVKCTVPAPKGAAAATVSPAEAPLPAGKGADPKKGGAAAATAKKGAAEPVAAPVPTNPLDAVIVQRTADPTLFAQLFAQMCSEANVTCEVVPGTLKGAVDILGKPLNFLPWAWNVVSIADKEGRSQQFLVDLGLSTTYVNSFEFGKGTSPPPPPAESTKPSSTLCQPRMQDTPTGTAHFEPFYYFTQPQSFASLHFPEDWNKSLLVAPVSRTQWEIAPRLSHEFFQLGLRTASHARRSVFTTKSTPFYVSVTSTELRTTDLTLRLHKGHVQQAEIGNTHSSSVLDSKFVWQQRDERIGLITFSLMMPEVGAYTAVISGRSLARSGKGGADGFPSGPYVPLVVYQVNVNFVSVNESMFPRQHLSPTLCKITEPLNHKVLLGLQRFSVVPCSPNILAVGVVNRPAPKVVAPKQSTAAAEAAAAAAAAASAAETPRKAKPAPSKKPQTPPLEGPPVAETPEVPVEKPTLALLSLNADKARFEGAVSLQTGVVEVWVFFGDPASLGLGKGSSASSSAAAASSSTGGGAASPGTPDVSASPAPMMETATTSLTKPLSLPPLKPIGAFYPFVTEIQVVKRIPSKESALNDGRSLIQPLPNLDQDRSTVLGLLTGAQDEDEGSLRTVGTYWASKKQ